MPAECGDYLSGMGEVRIPAIESQILNRVSIFAAQIKSFSDKPIDRMGGIFHATLIVANGYVRMMIFAMRNPGNRIDKSHGLIIVLEVVVFSDQVSRNSHPSSCCISTVTSLGESGGMPPSQGWHAWW